MSIKKTAAAVKAAQAVNIFMAQWLNGLDEFIMKKQKMLGKLIKNFLQYYKKI